MKYEITTKGNDAFIRARSASDRISEQMIKNLQQVVRNMNRFKPTEKVEYNGVEFDVEFETYPEIKGDIETGKKLCSVTRIGLAGLMLSEEAAEALNPDIYEILSDILNREKAEA